jgi:hypothetical protein
LLKTVLRGLSELLSQARDQFGGRQDVVDGARALAGGPDRLPGLGLVAHVQLVLGQGLRIDAVLDQRLAHEVGRDAGHGRGVDDVGRAAVDDHLLVGVGGHGFGRVDEAGAHIGEIGAQHQGGRHVLTRRKRAGQDDGPVEEAANLVDQGEGVDDARMAARAVGDQDQTIDAGLGRFSRMTDVGDVVEDHDRRSRGPHRPRRARRLGR